MPSTPGLGGALGRRPDFTSRAAVYATRTYGGQGGAPRKGRPYPNGKIFCLFLRRSSLQWVCRSFRFFAAIPLAGTAQPFSFPTSQMRLNFSRQRKVVVLHLLVVCRACPATCWCAPRAYQASTVGQEYQRGLGESMSKSSPRQATPKGSGRQLYPREGSGEEAGSENAGRSHREADTRRNARDEGATQSEVLQWPKRIS